VIRSNSTIEKAIVLGDLAEDTNFIKMDSNAIAAYLKNSPALTVNSVELSSGNAIFDIAYQSNRPETSLNVVQAMVDAYAMHVRETYQDFGRSALVALESAKGESLERLASAEKTLSDYKVQSASIFSDGSIQLIHRSNEEALRVERQNLFSKRSQLQSTLDAALAAEREGESTESILISLHDGLTVVVSQPSVGKETNKPKAEDTVLARSAQLNEERLLPLKARMVELTREYAAGHPAVRLLQSQISEVEKLLAEAVVKEGGRTVRTALPLSNNSDLLSAEDIERQMMDRVEASISSVRQQLAAVEQRLQALISEYDEAAKLAREEGIVEMRLAAYQRIIDREQILYDQVLGAITIIDRPTGNALLTLNVLNKPDLGVKVAPILQNSLLASGLLGALSGLGLILVIRVTDRRFNNSRQIVTQLKLPVITGVPAITANEMRTSNHPGSKVHSSLFSYHAAASKQAEAIRNAHYFLKLKRNSQSLKVLHVVGLGIHDAATTQAAELAITFAATGDNVLLIDADLLQPSIENLFGVRSTRGLTWLLERLPRNATETEIFDAMGDAIEDTVVTNLSVMAAGNPTDDSTRLLSSRTFEKLLDILASKFDYVIIGSTGLLVNDDAGEIAARTDSVLFALSIGGNSRKQAERGLQILRSRNANTIGILVNGVNSDDLDKFGYCDYDVVSRPSAHRRRRSDRNKSTFEEVAESTR
jgi:capsular exopolysaccharide synthesis family protein